MSYGCHLCKECRHMVRDNEGHQFGCALWWPADTPRSCRRFERAAPISLFYRNAYSAPVRLPPVSAEEAFRRSGVEGVINVETQP